MMNITRILKSEKGAVNVIVTMGLIAILGFTALVIDVGLILLEKNRLSNAADAAVLAGAQELPFNPTEAIETAKQYAVTNNAPVDRLNVFITEDNTKIEANINNDVDFAFAKVLGFDKTNVAVSSAAIVGAVTEVYDGIRPFVVENQLFTYGDRVVLKEGAEDGYKGNYGAVSLGGRGACVYTNNIKYGYNGKLKVGDIIYTEPGNMTGPTIQGVTYITDNDNSNFNNFTRDSLRVWTIPVVDSLEVNGRKPVEIAGFAVFFLEDAKKKAGKTEITGRFIEFVTNGDIDSSQTDYGLRGIKLIK